MPTSSLNPFPQTLILPWLPQIGARKDIAQNNQTSRPQWDMWTGCLLSPELCRLLLPHYECQRPSHVVCVCVPSHVVCVCVATENANSRLQEGEQKTSTVVYMSINIIHSLFLSEFSKNLDVFFFINLLD